MSRAEQLAQIADEYMETRQLPFSWDLGMQRLRAEAVPPAPDEPREVRFRAEWPDGFWCEATRPMPPGWWSGR